MNASGQLDASAVERLKRLGGTAFVVKMVDLFGSYGGEKLRAARAALETGNCVGVADAVHPIKSSAGNVGAKNVQALAQQIEQLARASNQEALPPLLADLEQAFANATRELEQVKISLSIAANEAK